MGKLLKSLKLEVCCLKFFKLQFLSNFCWGNRQILQFTYKAAPEINYKPQTTNRKQKNRLQGRNRLVPRTEPLRVDELNDC
jgi:hypothetical protein